MKNPPNDELNEILFDQEGPPYIHHSIQTERQASSDDHDRFITGISGWWLITLAKYVVGASLGLSAMYGLSKLIDWAHRQ